MSTTGRTLIQMTYMAINTVLPDPAADLRTWLTERAKEYSLRWLLAHTDAGVIWGEYRNDGEKSELHLSYEALPHIMPTQLSLDWLTLQLARLFGDMGELRLWHDGQQWHATLLQDQDSDTGYAFDEAYLLWGSSKRNPAEQADSFFLLKEDTRGIQHAPPISAPNKNKRAQLMVRHYLNEDADTGLLYIAVSRLVRLEKGT